MRQSPRGTIHTTEFIALYDEYFDQLIGYFMRRTFDPEVAADLTAETFAAAYASRSSLRNRGEPAGWLYGIGKHQLARYYRKGAVDRRARRRLAIVTPPLTTAGRDEIRALVGEDDRSEAVRAALEHLPADQREAVVLRIVDELGYDEIGRRVGCSAQSARARVSRGLRALRAFSQPPSTDSEGATR